MGTRIFSSIYSSVVIDHLDIMCVTLLPPNHDPPLIVDPNAVFARKVSFRLVGAWADGLLVARSCRQNPALGSRCL